MAPYSVQWKAQNLTEHLNSEVEMGSVSKTLKHSTQCFYENHCSFRDMGTLNVKSRGKAIWKHQLNSRSSWTSSQRQLVENQTRHYIIKQESILQEESFLNPPTHHSHWCPRAFLCLPEPCDLTPFVAKGPLCWLLYFSITDPGRLQVLSNA